MILPRDLHLLGSAAWRLCIFSATAGCPVTMVHVAQDSTVFWFPSACLAPPTHNQGPYDMSLSVVRHNKPLLSPPVTKA